MPTRHDYPSKGSEMDHPALRAIIKELLHTLDQHPLATLNEGFLEVIASEAAIYAGAFLIEGSNEPGNYNRLRIDDNTSIWCASRPIRQAITWSLR